MCVEDEVDHLAHDAAPALAGADVVHVLENLRVGVFRGDREAAAAKGGNVHDVVADEADLVQLQAAPARDLFDARSLRPDPLMDLFEVELFGAGLDRNRAAAGNDAEIQAAGLPDAYGETVARVTARWRLSP